MMPALGTYLLPELSKLAPFAEAGARFARMEGRMRREKVDSTTLQSVGYESKGQVLEVEFCSGARYRYFEVSAEEHQGLLSAESKGRYFNLHIRDQYRFERLA
jgi:hypothetical protein